MLLPSVEDVFPGPNTGASVVAPPVPRSPSELSTVSPMGEHEPRPPAVRRQDIPAVLKKLVGMFALSGENAAKEMNGATVPDPDNSALVFDIDALRAAFASVRDAYPPHWVHCFAMKCCPLVFVIQELLGAGFGVEAASFVELYMAMAHGCDPTRAVFDSPAKTDEELELALGSGALINVNSLDELDRIASIFRRQGTSGRNPGRQTPTVTARVGIRLNPQLGAGAISELSTSVSSSKFGVPVTPQNVRAVVEAFRKWPWVVGLHTHVGSQGYSLEQLAEGIAILCDVADVVDSELGKGRVTVIDIGGGLPANYCSDDVTPTFSDHAAVLRKIAPRLFENTERQVVTEFGRSLVAKAAIMVSKIEYVRNNGPSGGEQSGELPTETSTSRSGPHLEARAREEFWRTEPKPARGHQTLVTHVGADMFLRSSYCPSNYQHRLSVYGKHGEVLSSPRIKTDVAGPLCFEGDYIARGTNLPRASVGDLVVTHDTGANTISLFSRHCSRRAPAIYGYARDEDGKISIQMIKKKESVRDVARFWGAR